MFSVLSDGPGRYRLENGAGARAGWIHGRAIGFRGLRNEAEAIVAASAGWRTLQNVLRREYAAWPRHAVDWERLRFVNDGAHDWVSDGRVPLARVTHSSRASALRRGDATPVGTTGEFAVEFVVPSWLGEECVVPLAHALWHVLAPLLGDTSGTVGPARHESHPEWLPSSHTIEASTEDELVVA